MNHREISSENAAGEAWHPNLKSLGAISFLFTGGFVDYGESLEAAALEKHGILFKFRNQFPQLTI